MALNKSALLNRVIKKLAYQASPGTFLIIDKAVYFSKFDGGMDWDELWSNVVKQSFPKIGFMDKMSLKRAYEGVDRGRVTWIGEVVNDKPHGQGSWVVEGSEGCKEHEKKILHTFSLDDPDLRLPIKVSWGHPKVNKEKSTIINQMISKYTPHFKNTIVISESN